MDPKHRFAPRHRVKKSYQRIVRFGTALLMLVMTAGFAAAAPAANAYTIHRGDTLTSIARHFHVSVRSLIRVNHIRHPNLIYFGHHLIIPKHGSAPAPVRRNRGAAMLLCGPGRGQFNMPVSPAYVTQGYAGPFPHHSGIDLAGPYGSTVRSVAPGKVIGVWNWGYSYGHHVLIRHACGETLYAHLHSIYVHSGQGVGQGQAIGSRDTSGNSTGNHLHFEVIKNGYPVNPAPYLFKNAYGGAGPAAFTGHDKASKLTHPLYDWRVQPGYAPEIVANFNVARAAARKPVPLVLSPCLMAHAQAFLQQHLSRPMTQINHDGLVPPLVLSKDHGECGPSAELVAHGHRRPDLAVYDWLLNRRTGGIHGPSRFASSEATTPTLREIVLDSKWRSIGVATAMLGGFHHEVVLVGTEVVSSPGQPFTPSRHFVALPPGR